MFTNWLTSSSPSTSSSSSVNVMGALPPTAAAIIATPPDIILEVGPPNAPSARFVAHSIILAMHSGYLRSAIRLDENGVPNSDLPIFLTNVTPEQFSPLLTYMYTGYLDLNIENIFGVLLATHVLHMPRALEICRNFLSRMQSEGYLSGTFLSHMNEINNDSSTSSTTTTNLSSMNSVKVIRPIASKPAISNFGFIVPPMPHISLPSTGTPFRSLNNQNKLSSSPPLSALSSSSSSSSIMIKSSSELQKSPDMSTSSSPIIQSSNHHRSLSLVKSPITTKDLTIKRSTKLKRASSSDKSKRSDQSHQSQLQQQQKQQQQSQIPTTSSTLTSSSSLNHHHLHSSRKESTDNENKIIIDVASCDGPVRFRRVLNDAYGKQPQTIDLIHAHSQERSHQSVSYSFHQQMAKNISQQRQQNSEESENSQDSSTKQHHHSHSHNHNHNHNHHNHNHNQSTNNNSNTCTTGEVYNCVYCKHTFKSQYCYQKHAKRHLNPLSLESSSDIPSGICSNVSGTTTIPAIVNHSSSSSSLISTAAVPTSSSSDAAIINSNSATTTNSTTTSSSNTINNMNSNNTSRNNIISSSQSSSSLDNKDDNKYLNRSSLDLKREVRPLDMNVQYYPCKTCGSKFPSYYFVHKHRKMCHANEDN